MQKYLSHYQGLSHKQTVSVLLLFLALLFVNISSLFRITVLAGDTLPIEVYCHIPIMCEDRALPYAYIPSKTVIKGMGNVGKEVTFFFQVYFLIYWQVIDNYFWLKTFP